MKFFLIVAKGSKKGLPIPIAIDLFLIGSDKICQLRKESLGGRHCALVTRDEKVFVRDMDSGQSTIVNGSAIPTGAEWPLHAGDRISVGSLEFLVQFHELGMAQKDLEEWAINCLDDQHDTQAEEMLVTRQNSAASAAQSILNQLNALTGVVKGRLRIGHEGMFIVIRFNDSMLVDESEIALVKKELWDYLNKPNQRVLLDLKNVTKLSSAAAMMLGDVYRRLRPLGGKLAFCRIQPEIESAMSMLMTDEIPIFKDKKSALAAKW